MAAAARGSNVSGLIQSGLPIESLYRRSAYVLPPVRVRHPLGSYKIILSLLSPPPGQTPAIQTELGGQTEFGGGIRLPTII